MEQGGCVSGDGNKILLESKHKIFLSHSGAQKDFVKQLCLDIETRDRYPFFDIRRNSLPIGVHFPNEIFQAIRQCQVGVLILSEEFFTRTKWPMLEFAALVNMKNQNANLIIIPVFLGITHEECRKKENHLQWLSKWEEWARLDNRIDIQGWMEALKIFGPTNGISCHKILGEVECREEILQAICELIPPETKWDDFHIQGRTRLCKIINQHFEKTHISSIYRARVVGLYGVGGIGKTTFCKALCNYFFKKFRDKVCHIEFSNGNESKFLELLHTMIKKLTNIKDEVLTRFDIGECTALLKRNIHREKIFLAIDNVSDSTTIIDQTKALLNFGYNEGSIILVATRSFDLLQLLNLNDIDIIEMPELNEDEAKSLFLYQTLISSSEVYNEAIKASIERCRFYKGYGSNSHYHPLALKVLSVQLGNNPNDWMEMLKNLDAFNQLREKEHPIFSILRKSFDSLLLEDQHLFMDVVLFFPEDNNHETWTNLFKWLSMVHGKTIYDIKRQLDNLKRKSLIESVGDGSRRIGIHDLWHEFCITETTIGEMKSRRWLYEVYCSQFNGESNLSTGGWKILSRICLKGDSSENMVVKEIDLHKCSKLIILKVVKLNLENSLFDLSPLKLLKSLEIYEAEKPFSIRGLGLLKHLVVLKLNPLSIESHFIEEIGSLTKLQVLELNSNNKIDKLLNIKKLIWLQELMLSKIWDGINTSTLGLSSQMRHIESLNLSNCSSLQNSHGLHELITLKLLRIKLCPMLEEIYNIHHLQMLQQLLIQGCRQIKSLSGIDDLMALEKLKLISCENLVEVPNLQKLNRLQMLYIQGCKSIKALPGLGDLIALNDLRFEDCENLCEVPSLHKIERLQILSIENCKSIKELVGLGNLILLEELVLKSCQNLQKVPNLCKLKKLRLLYVEGCELITSLCGLGNLKALEELELKYLENLSKIPNLQKMKRLQIVDLEGCKSIKKLFGLNDLIDLQSLILNGCENLTKISNLQKLKKLKILYMEGCKSITTLFGLDDLISLDDLRLSACENLRILPNLQNLKRLQILYLDDCKSIKTLPGLDNLITIQHLMLDGCKNLVEVPNLEKLENLQVLDMENCNSIKALPGLNNLRALKNLKLNYCKNLEEVPNLQKLQNLHLLYMEECKSLKLLSGLDDLKALNDLRLNACELLEAIPNLQKMENLQILNISNCKSMKRLFGLSNLIALEYLILSGCENLIEVHNLQHLKNLRLLSMEGCKSITSLPSLGDLKALEDLSLNGCQSLRDIHDLQKLKQLCLLNMEGCKSITTLPSLGKLIALKDLRLNACENLKSLPNLGKLKRLEILYMGGCKSIKKLFGLGNLISLNDIRLNSCENLGVISNLRKLQKLEIIHMEGCKSIKTLSGLEDLISLKELILNFCENFIEVPNLQKLEQLHLLYMEGCKSITKLCGLSNLINLHDLRLNACTNLLEIPNLQKLKNLRILKMEGCKLIKALPGLEDMIALEQLKVDNCVNLLSILGIYKLKNLGLLSMVGCKLIASFVDVDKLPIGCIFRPWNYDYEKNHASTINYTLPQFEMMNVTQSRVMDAFKNELPSFCQSNQVLVATTKETSLKHLTSSDLLRRLPLQVETNHSEFNAYCKEQYNIPPFQALDYFDHSTFGNSKDEVQYQSIQCDLCDMEPIIGTCYKSKKLQDFDLCQNCVQQWGRIEDYVKIDLSMF